MKYVFLATALLFVSACQGPVGTGKPVEGIVISKDVYSELQKYLGLIGQHDRGAFAVSTDGGEYWRSYCKRAGCSNMARLKYFALEGCERYGAKCFLLAEDKTFLVTYKVAE